MLAPPSVTAKSTDPATVATVAAVRATGAGPTTAARRILLAANGMSVSFLIGLDRGQERLHRDAAGRYQLPAGPAHRRPEGSGPAVLPDQHRGRAARLDGRGDRRHVLLAEEERQFGLVRTQAADLALVEVAELEEVQGAVLVLADQHQVQDPDRAVVHKRVQSRRDLAREPAPRELHHQPVHRPQLVVGKKKAAIAVGHSILVICWHLLTDARDYDDLGGDYFTRRNPDRQRDRLISQLQTLGYRVSLDRVA